MTGNVLNTEFPDINLLRRGKVRDIYDLGEHLLLVATDRISAFDVVLPDGIPGKGRVLTQISIFWFRADGGYRAKSHRSHRCESFSRENSRNMRRYPRGKKHAREKDETDTC